MKHIWIMSLLLLAWPIGSVGLQRGLVLIEDPSGREVTLYRESHALLIGVSNYTSGWPRLPGVKRDLEAVRATLEEHGFQVEVINDPNQATLVDAYEGFIRRHGLVRDNRLLFYFAGHGHTFKPAYARDDPEDWMGYIVSRDAPLPVADFPGFLENAMSMQRFEELAKQIQAKHALFVFDSCFSGSVFALTRAAPENISHKTARPVRQFITSGSADQEVPDKSEFRHQFVAALAGAGDLSGDGYVTGSELGLFLEEKVTNYSKRTQTPQYGKLRHRYLDKGDFVFTLAEPAPPPVPRLRRGNVQVDVDVPATVYFNDERVGEAQPGKPLNQRGVFVGSTEVRVEAAGFKAARQWAQVQPGKWIQLSFDLVQLQENARLTVRSNVYGDQVYIDGQLKGSTRLDMELTPGRHIVRVEKEGYVPDEQTVELKSGRNAIVRATLSKAPVADEQAEPVMTKRPAVTSAPESTREPRIGDTWTEPVTGMEFVWIAPGCFQMGSPESEAGRSSDERQHQVCVEGFWLGKYEVTNAQFRRFRRNHDSGKFQGHSLNGDNQPVVEVDWKAASDFAAWLSGKSGKPFRLPSEAEWEYAARAGTKTARFWEDDPDEACTYANVGDKNLSRQFGTEDIHDCDDGFIFTAPVGRFQPNPYGLYDVLGNVWEWTCSVDDDYFGAEMVCASQGSSGRRVIRGGAWAFAPQHVRSAGREEVWTDDHSIILGFRLARTP